MTRTIPHAASSELLLSQSLATAFPHHRADQSRLLSRAAVDIDLDQEATPLGSCDRRTVTNKQRMPRTPADAARRAGSGRVLGPSLP